MIRDDSYKLVGAGYAVLVSTVPEWLMSTAMKLVIAIVTAFLTGLAYRAGGALMDKLRKGKQ